MNERFGDGALRLAGIAGRVLGWPPDWFWNATPAEITAILFAHGEPAAGGIDRKTIEQMMERERDGR
jgi:hypothetical protein